MADPALAPLLAQFALAYGAMLVIPGPNTLLVLRSCDGLSRLRPLSAAAGLACGATLASVVAASSAAALPSGPAFRVASGLLVAALLLRAAVGASRGRRPAAPAAAGPVRAAVTPAGAAPFLAGLCVAGLNPVSVPYFASFFVSHTCGALASGLACMLVFALAGLWFSAVGLASDRLRRLPVPAAGRRALDLIMAAALTGLALRYLWMTVA